MDSLQAIIILREAGFTVQAIGPNLWRVQFQQQFDQTANEAQLQQMAQELKQRQRTTPPQGETPPLN